MLLKGLAETTQAARPLAAADMVLVRLCHAASLPTPDEAIRMLQNDAGEGAIGGNGAGTPAGHAAPAATSPPVATIRSEPAAEARPRGNLANLNVAAQPAYQLNETVTDHEPVTADLPRLRHFDDLVALAREKRDRLMVFALERHIRPVRFEPGQIEIKLTPDAEADLPHRLAEILREWTGERWIVAVSDGDGVATVHERRQSDKQAQIEAVKSDPLVASALSQFPGAEIVAVRGQDDDNNDDEPDKKTN